MNSSVLYLFNLENSSCDEKNSTVSYPYNWPSIHIPLTNQSPKLYTLVKNIRTANLENSLSLERQISNGNEMHVTVEMNHLQVFNNISFRYIEKKFVFFCQTSSPDNDRAPEIARKFYSSLRNISQLDNSLSLESYNNDAPLTSNNPGSIIDSAINSKRKEYRNLFRTPRFSQSIPHTGL